MNGQSEKKLVTAETLTSISVPKIRDNGKWLYESGSEDLFDTTTSTKDYIVNIDLHADNKEGTYTPLYRVYVSSLVDGTQEDDLIDSPETASKQYNSLVQKYNSNQTK